jgi:general secretion pathway protein E/type IV pilus assembly protein PilB
MGVQPFLVSSAIQGVAAQRLVRRVCKECKELYVPEPAEVRVLGLDPAVLAGRSFARGRGCRACEGSGFRGRLGLFELFELDSDLRDAIFRGVSLEAIRAQALARGRLRPLSASGAGKVLAGLTTVTEVLRVTRAAVE